MPDPMPSRIALASTLVVLIFLMGGLLVPLGDLSNSNSNSAPFNGPSASNSQPLSGEHTGPQLLETQSYYRYPNGSLMPVPDEDEEGGRAVEDRQPFTHQATRMVPRDEIIVSTGKAVNFFDDHLNEGNFINEMEPQENDFYDWMTETGDFDGDGREETVIGGRHGSDVSLWVVDDRKAKKGAFSNMSHGFKEKIFGVEDDDNVWGLHRGHWRHATGDFDGDGKDEIGVVAAISEQIPIPEEKQWEYFGQEYVVGTFVRVVLFDDAETGFAKLTDWKVAYGFLCDITMGDMTGNAHDEIIITATEANKWDVNLFLFQYNETSNTKMTPLIRNKAAQSHWSGGEDEGMWWGKEVNIGADPKEGNQRQDSDVTTGDLDGDGRQEVIVLTGAHERLDEEEDMSTMMDAYDYIPEENNVSRYKKFPDDWNTFHDDSGWLRLRVKTGDVDGDMMDEIIVGGPWDDDIDAWVFDDAQHSFKLMKRWDDNDGDLGDKDPDKAREGRRGGAKFDVGDVDCDGKDEIVFVTNERGSKIPSFFFGLVGGGDTGAKGAMVWIYDDVKGMAEWEEDGKKKQEADMPLLDSFRMNRNDDIYDVDLGDLDGDGIVLKYNGDHSIRMSKPRPIAVLAAPPQYMPNGPPYNENDFPQNYILSGTTYGKGSMTGSGTSSSHTDSVSVGASVSFGYSTAVAGDYMATFTTTMNWEFTQTNSNTELVTVAKEFNGDADGDTIIYQTVKFDVYNYTVVGHYDPKAIGSYTKIEVPRKDWWYKEYLTYYNEMPYIKKRPEYQIGKDVFKHSVGKPWTYSTVAESNDIMGKAEAMMWKTYVEETFPFKVRRKPVCRYPEYCGGWQSESVFVGHGGGTQAVTIDLSKEKITENSKTFGMDFELKFEAEYGSPLGGPQGGFGVSAGYGFSNTESTSIVTGEETVYQGVVGDISEADAYEEYGYGFGLFVYNHKRAPDFGFQVINYWVEDFNPVAAGMAADIDCAAALDMEPSGKYLPDKCMFDNSPKVKGAITVPGENGQGTALSFDGVDDHVTFETPLFLAPPGNLTVSANIKPEGNASGTIFYNGDRGEVKLYVEDNKLKFGVRLGAQVGTESEAEANAVPEGRSENAPVPPPSENLTVLDEPQWVTLSYPLNLTADEWKRVSATYSVGDRIVLYLDGVEVVNRTLPPYPLHDPGRGATPSIGSTNGSEGEFFYGLIDDVIVLKRIMNGTNETRNVDYFMAVNDPTGGKGTAGDACQDCEAGTDAGDLCLVLIPFIILLILALLLLYWDELMYRLGYKERPDECCIFCGSAENLHHGHLVAPSKGGQKPVTACQKCNLSKGDKALMDWLRWTKVERPERWTLMVDWNEEPKEGEVPEKVRKVRDEHTPVPREKGSDRTLDAVKMDEEGENCVYCGVTEPLTRDHVVARGHEPTCACTGCHLSRKDKGLEEWLEHLKENREEKWVTVVAHNKGKRGEVPEHVRSLRDQQDDTCIFCGSQEKIHQTTLVAASKGGKKPVAACESCFRSKGTKALMDWLRWTRAERPERWQTIKEWNKGKRGEVPTKVHTVRDEPISDSSQPRPKEEPPKNKAKTKEKAPTKQETAGEVCPYCGATTKLTRKHVMYAGKEPEVACTSCHISRGKKEMDQWFRDLKTKKPAKWEQVVEHNKKRRHKLAQTMRKVRDEPEA